MEVVWAAPGPLTAREVAEALADRGLAYTTWLTVLGRLERKGLLRRDKSGRAHTYTGAASREDHVAVLMQQALGQARDRRAVLQHFARTVTPEEAEALRRALDALGAGPHTAPDRG
ncbi:MAG: BlaI/MecI/CopY family transcriptional regulator [Actinomycetota bacterium]|nr:BlaI/MecI/CopY family transcriptional regulator [Actinomycetota bacterium]